MISIFYQHNFLSIIYIYIVTIPNFAINKNPFLGIFFPFYINALGLLQLLQKSLSISIVVDYYVYVVLSVILKSYKNKMLGSEQHNLLLNLIQFFLNPFAFSVHGCRRSLSHSLLWISYCLYLIPDCIHFYWHFFSVLLLNGGKKAEATASAIKIFNGEWIIYAIIV